MPRDPAESILEYLTAKNPDLKHEDDPTKSLTTSRSWRVPKQVLPWKDFNFETLEKIFDGRLMEELRRGDRSLRYPYPELDKLTEATEVGEDTTINIAFRWTRPIVRLALEAVENVFNHVLWVAPSYIKLAGSRPETLEPEEGPSNIPTNKTCRAAEGSSAKRSRPRSNPDGGGVVINSQASLSGANPSSNSANLDNRLPCEIKSGAYWTSHKLRNGDLVDQSGQWRSRKIRSRDAAPLLQIFNYCVDCQARYGFLITGKEVLAVRIRPKDTPSNQSAEDLFDKLSYQGLMEYKSIPWDNHGSGDDYKELTISLAIWFLCILAGNDHRPKWSYCDLVKENLADKAQSSNVDGGIQPLTQVSNADTEDVDPSALSSMTQTTQSTGVHSFTTDSDGVSSQVRKRGRKRTRAPRPPQEGSPKKRRAA